MIIEFLVGKSSQLLRGRQAVPKDIAGHGAAAHFGIYDDGFQFVAVADEELGFQHFHFAFHPFPVEQAGYFLCGQMHQAAVVLLHGIDQHIGQARFPKVEHTPVVVVGEFDTAFQPVVFDPVLWSYFWRKLVISA